MIRSAFGLIVLAAIAWAFSENRRAVSVRFTAAGIAMQLVIATVLIKLPGAQYVLIALNHVVGVLEKASLAGTSFVFGYIGGGNAPFEVAHSASSFILAFQALPLVLLISALSALLFHWGILQRVVAGMAFVLRRTLGLGGPLGVLVSSNIFLGMAEAPLLIRPYIGSLTRSELFVMMTCGMAMIAGTVMVVYAIFLQGVVPNPIGQLLTASLISAPASITVARLMIPDAGSSTSGQTDLVHEYRSSMDAVAKGTADGLYLILGIVPMLIVLVALVALVNQGLALLPVWDGTPVTLQRLFGVLLSPVAWLMGVPWHEAGTAGGLLGTKVVLNEFIAYLDFTQLPPDALSAHSKLIMTFALCSFANFGSLGIMIGGLGSLAPARRDEVVSLGLRAILSGTIASCMTGATAGLLT